MASLRRGPCRGWFSRRVVLTAAILALVAGCGANSPTETPDPVDPPRSDTVRIALTDMGQRTYKGFSGGLYAGGNDVPIAHANLGAARARLVVPLDAAGAPSASGKYVLLSVGFSNATQEFCSQNSAPPCDPWTFMSLAAADPEVNRGPLAIVNGAKGGQATDTWDSPADTNYDWVRDAQLAPLGLTERQVQVVWLKVALAQPQVALPATGADAYQLERETAQALRAIRVRYPNVRQVFLASRIYAGYATTTLNPEPYAYEGGFSVKWVIDAQIRQAASGAIDSIAGDLNPNTVAPWVSWGPYLWADGQNARSDGLAWIPADFQADGTHPARTGEQKVATMLLAFFKTSPLTRCWFLATGGAC